MTIPANLLVRRDNIDWTNHHGTVRVPARARLTLFNRSTRSTMAGMRETAGHLQSIVRDAVAQNMRLRAIGSRWSFSEVASPRDGWALETENLDMSFKVSAGSLDSDYGGTAEELLLVQCGRSISRVNLALEDRSRLRALRTSGASNGQTVAGAIGTGTHGSAIDVGGLESQVAGFQLLTANRNLWVERPSDPVMSAGFATQLGAQLTRDDTLFRAGLVSLGALGLVHSVLLRSTGRYFLRSFLRRMDRSVVERAMNTLDFSGVPLPIQTVRPYFFQAVIEPSNPRVAYVTTRYKEFCPPSHRTDFSERTGYEPGNDLPGVIGKLLDIAPDLRPLVVRILVQSELREFSDRLKTPGENYDYTTSRSGVAGAAIAVPLAYATRALDRAVMAFEANRGAPVVLACRYAQKSPALLGFTRFDPTCIIDIDGVNSQPTLALMEETRRLLDQDGIPYADHWGKMHGLTAQRLRASYGSDIDRWNAVRRGLLDPAERHIFSTPLIDAIGLNA